MLFKKLRTTSSPQTSNKPGSTNLPRLKSTQPASGDNEVDKSSTTVLTRERSDDYEVFLENARKEVELKEKAILKLAKEAEKRRMEFNMDPWASRW